MRWWTVNGRTGTAGSEAKVVRSGTIGGEGKAKSSAGITKAVVGWKLNRILRQKSGRETKQKMKYLFGWSKKKRETVVWLFIKQRL